MQKSYSNTGSGRRANVKSDKFGNSFIIVACKPDKNPDFCKGFIELKGILYKVEPSTASDKSDGVSAWVKITELKARPNRQM